jgi:hypothetical protein
MTNALLTGRTPRINATFNLFAEAFDTAKWLRTIKVCRTRLLSASSIQAHKPAGALVVVKAAFDARTLETTLTILTITIDATVVRLDARALITCLPGQAVSVSDAVRCRILATP